eukprot:s86_g25.t1
METSQSNEEQQKRWHGGEGGEKSEARAERIARELGLVAGGLGGPEAGAQASEFNRIFSNHLEKEILIWSFPGSVKVRKFRHPGKIFITNNRLCFYSNILGVEVSFAFNWIQIASLNFEENADTLSYPVLVSFKETVDFAGEDVQTLDMRIFEFSDLGLLKKYATYFVGPDLFGIQEEEVLGPEAKTSQSPVLKDISMWELERRTNLFRDNWSAPYFPHDGVAKMKWVALEGNAYIRHPFIPESAEYGMIAAPCSASKVVGNTGWLPYCSSVSFVRRRCWQPVFYTEADDEVSPELERLRTLAVEQQKGGEAPLPVVRLFFVGRGRAGKTTTLRRLKGESLPDEEPSTHGVEVWAGQAEAHLKADASATGKWKEWKESESMHRTAIKDALQKVEKEGAGFQDVMAHFREKDGAEVASSRKEGADGEFGRESSPSQVENPATVHSPAPSPANQTVYAPVLPELPGTCGPTIMDEDTLSKILSGEGPEKGGVEVRLQCWDFPGQEEYALLNQIYFSERAIYLVFFDLTGKIDVEWRHICFWLWAIVRFSKEKNAEPPILLLGTKAGEPDEKKLDEFELQKRLEELQAKIPGLKAQLRPHPTGSGDRSCTWLFPVENRQANSEDFICPLRLHLQHVALQLLTQKEKCEVDSSGIVPRFAGLQAKPFPLSWLQAHDLLTRLGSGFRAQAQIRDVEKAAPHAKLKPGLEIETTANLPATLPDKGWLIVPRGSSIRLESKRSQEEIDLKVSCDFLQLEVVQELLQGMRPVGLSPEDSQAVLGLLDQLGIVVWMDKPDLRNLVLLNPRRLAVAMAKLMTLCFGAENFEHADDYINIIEGDATQHDHGPSHLLRFRSTGIATRWLIEGVWKKDFPEESQRKLIQQILLRKQLMFERLVEDEFVLPNCLPVAHCREEILKDTDEVVYLDLAGLLSPNFFPALVQKMFCQINSANSRNTVGTWKPGPPQVFRNHGEFHSGTSSVFISLYPVSLGTASTSSSKSLLRLLVQGDSKEQNREVAEKVKQLLAEYMGFDPRHETNPASFFRVESVAKDTEEFEHTFASTPCMNVGCEKKCSLCRLRALLKERFLPDLSSDLRSVVESAAFFQQHTRPAGSLRFKAMKYPGDVDLEEYLVIDAKSRDDALRKLCSEIQTRYSNFAPAGDVEVFFRGLKAGRKPTAECDPGDEYLTWTHEQISSREESVTKALEKALEEGHCTWTAKLDMFAKVRLFETSEQRPYFFEVTNVVRAGWFENSEEMRRPIQPITKEKDFLQAVEKNLDKYSGEEPNAMKYVKRLWERSAYLAQRGFDLDWHLTILEALHPLLGHWVAEFSQVAAHVETIIKMMKSSDELFQHACADLPTLRENLRRLEHQLQCADVSEIYGLESQQAAEVGSDILAKAMEYIEGCIALIAPPEAPKEKEMSGKLLKTQLLLESCAETVLINKLGLFEVPLAKPLGELWKFPSDHPPIAAVLTLGNHSIKVASWNVLNRNYYKYIEANTQGLRGSEITTYHVHKDGRESKIVEKIEEMLGKGFDILCLQECWPTLLKQLGEALRERRSDFQMRSSGEEADKNKEAILFHSKFSLRDSTYFRDRGPERIYFHSAFRENSKKVVTEAHFKHDGMGLLRVVTTHLPGAPFGRARQEFADCMASIVKGEKLPTVLLADLNFPEKAIQPLLLDLDVDASFVRTPYPTNICQGSLLPKRIDSIAVINHEVEGAKLEAKALKAEDILKGLGEVVELLKSRSAEPLTPMRYQSDKVVPSTAASEAACVAGLIRSCSVS